MISPKPSTLRDPHYIEWIHVQCCVICGSHPPNVAHHVFGGGMGNKCSDRATVPVCTTCHSKIHQHTSKGGFCSKEQLDDLLERLQHEYEIKGRR